MNKGAKKSISGWLVLFINMIGITILIILFINHNKSYEQNIRNQNLTNISNLNESSGELSIKFFENQQRSLQQIAQLTSKRKLSLDQLLSFLNDFTNEKNVYELIGKDSTGYLVKKDTNGKYINLSYASNDYKSLHVIFENASRQTAGVVKFAPEFTDDYEANKCFSMYTVIPTYEIDGTNNYYTLMILSHSQAFNDMIQINGNYEKMKTVLFDKDGNYIIGNPSFKSDNFFQYIAIYNDLSLDEKKALQQQVISSKEGTLFYKNSRKDDCTYIYQSLREGEWYIISCVPIDSFQDISEDFRLIIFMVSIILLVFLLDIVWLSALNRKLRVSMEKERRANDAKTDFLSRMSHDIRTPLNAVIGFSDLAMKEPNLTSTLSDHLEKVHSSGKYLLGLVNDILDMSKIESNKFTIHDSLVNRMIFLDDISSIFKAQAKQKEICLITDFTDSLTPWVYMDELRSRQIYSNLLNNAIKFSDSGTKITWRITETSIAKDQIEIESVISDEGCGMSQEFMKNIFQPFEQEHNSHSMQEGGTGLGLSIVKNLVELMGGTIEVESELGRGTTFTIHLKRFLGEPNETNADLKQGEMDLSILEGKRVLLCEDHPLNREITVKLLQKQGMLIETAENGRIGLSMFEVNACEYYNLILMDIRMPVMNGFEATKEIRNSGKADAKTIPIIAMTANAFDDDIQNCWNAGMNDHVEKPVQPQKFYFTIAQHLS